jgi:hypothetical protein
MLKGTHEHVIIVPEGYSASLLIHGMPETMTILALEMPVLRQML